MDIFKRHIQLDVDKEKAKLKEFCESNLDKRIGIVYGPKSLEDSYYIEHSPSGQLGFTALLDSLESLGFATIQVDPTSSIFLKDIDASDWLLLNMHGLYHAGAAPEIAHLLWQGLGIDAHCDKGWIHEGLAELLRHHGIPAQAVDMGTDILSVVDIIRSNRLLIASVAGKLLCDGRRGGHLIVVRGLELDDSGQLARIYFNDPSTWGQVNHSSNIDRFLCSFSGRAIIS